MEGLKEALANKDKEKVRLQLQSYKQDSKEDIELFNMKYLQKDMNIDLLTLAVIVTEIAYNDDFYSKILADCFVNIITKNLTIGGFLAYMLTPENGSAIVTVEDASKRLGFDYNRAVQTLDFYMEANDDSNPLN